MPATGPAAASPLADAPTVAAVLAGGIGARMGAAVPKQLLDVGGKPVIRHTLEAFEAAPEIDLIVVVTAEGYADRTRAIAREAKVTKLADVIPGGATRAESSRAAVRWTADRLARGADCRLLIHDAARMLVSGRVIAAVAAALDRHDAVSAAVPSTDTIIEVRSEGGEEFFAAVPDRRGLRRLQTPQGFRLSVLRAAYEAADAAPVCDATDDCSVVLRHLPHVPVAVVGGEERNLKVTEPIDLVVAATLLDASPEGGRSVPGGTA